uniref:(northern house mosquito) hypothetical protein n=1 Tax=Culex pipiens TaxID=7175 RepID=A0A8D8C307_CULPI
MISVRDVLQRRADHRNEHHQRSGEDRYVDYESVSNVVPMMRRSMTDVLPRVMPSRDGCLGDWSAVLERSSLQRWTRRRVIEIGISTPGSMLITLEHPQSAVRQNVRVTTNTRTHLHTHTRMPTE